MPGDVAKAHSGVTSFREEAETVPSAQDLVVSLSLIVAAFMNLQYILGMSINGTLQRNYIG